MYIDAEKYFQLHPDFTTFQLPFADTDFSTEAFPKEAFVDITTVESGHPLVAGFKVTHAELTDKEGRTFPVVVFQPEDQGDEKLPGLYYMHGGGYWIPYMWADLVIGLSVARDNHCVMITNEYVQATEAAFPAGLEQCYQTAEWMWDHADEFGIDRSNMVIGGESGGANFTAAINLMLRDRNSRARFTGAFTLTPNVDDDTTRKTYVVGDAGNPDVMSSTFLRKCWDMYTRDGIPEGMESYRSPLKAKDFHGMPRTFVETEEFDILCDEGVEYASRLSMDDVPVIFYMVRGSKHAWFGYKGEYRDQVYANRMKCIKKLFEK